MTRTELVKLCRRWQERLRLKDWDIEIAFCEDMPQSTVADCFWFTEEHKADIRMRPEGDPLYQNSSVEEALIHEMLHIRYEGHKPCGKSYDAHRELAHNTLAALLAPRRKKT